MLLLLEVLLQKRQNRGNVPLRHAAEAGNGEILFVISEESPCLGETQEADVARVGEALGDEGEADVD